MTAVREFTVPFSELTLRREPIVRALGYHDVAPPAQIAEMIDDIIRLVRDAAHPRCGFTICDSVDVAQKQVTIQGVRMCVDPIIAAHLRASDAVAVFVATAGSEIERIAQRYAADGDALSMLIADALGSEAAEATADVLEGKLLEFVQSRGWNITNRFSPGYCGWDVAEQRQLFSLLPTDFCSVTLTESALMQPVKSVSGIIGVGSRVRREEYQCSACSIEACIRRV